MAPKSSTMAQRSSPSDPAEQNDAKGVSSRRLKKREIDRRCQRQARERTKTRIAYLEGLVEDFRRKDASGQVATLMQQLKDVEAERDTMSKTLKDIQKAMDVHRPPRVGEDEQAQSIDLLGSPGNERNSSIISMADDAPLALKTEPGDAEAEIADSFDLSHFTPSPTRQFPPQDMLFAPEIVRLDTDSQRPMSQAIVQAKKREENPMPSRHADRVPGRRPVWQGNYWRYANEVLSERFDWTDNVFPESDAMSDDVPIRVLLEGWDAVEQRGPLHPSWQILRRIDQTLFASCPKTERLVILRAMHTLLQFHTESTSERYQKLPPWYMRRPSQTIAHSYAIDFFAWPGIRERFIFGEHNYCQNEFWHLFCKSLRFLWPYEFRDCYTREVETGLYKISTNFDQRLTDIKCWTMGPDIFQRFPELYGDMPSFNHIPRSVSTTALQKRKTPAVPSATPVKTTQPVGVLETDEDVPKPLPRQSRPLPLHSSHLHVQQPNAQAYTQHIQGQPPSNNPHAYDISEFNHVMALDAFAYGAISETDFANVYQPEMLDNFQNVIF
ncbi:hypothetical protein LTR10_023288 [Elasticomyces elasticus]|uniref:BZIP domain-containing protein n=1 Tax=Exophiala sideris TaxID=1016849 RepID=A0ABR0IZX4_9EURO|nr:hypothetical protein LTR10_023288 [Elasticomyces elasticus]KAK5023092.1 hypothetical protein LTS07_009585 [Exophiala sideris]KAK5026817.1 hypothetical protein LTR13_009857 [Exophiala sideris]KAK5052470.1 hypothetical protein LTR69_009808 [Exophiala sideris]KAK5178255.1 hypothetical protein LTR44_009339 [Eurotiomycetes sp. CCFEE 6388]